MAARFSCDEIGDMPMELPVKRLRVLQEREFQRLGSSEIVRVDIWVVAATNCDLTKRIEEGRFRSVLALPAARGPLQMPLRVLVRRTPPRRRHISSRRSAGWRISR
jgi:transcriptional regulator with GAF, ATPase, and Fis domain